MAHTPSAYADVADALKTIIDAEYAAEGWTAIHDNLHPAQGQSGVRIGIAPEEESGRAGNVIQNDISLTVKFYRRWDSDVDIHKKIDPREITGYAERFKKAVRLYNGPNTARLWYFNLVRIRYPSDPVGNKSRFEADLVAYGNNAAFVETVG